MSLLGAHIDKRLNLDHNRSEYGLRKVIFMKLSKSIKPISFFKAHAADILKDINETHGTMILTQNGEAKAVIQDIDEYERIQEALALMKMIAQGQEDYEKGKTIPADEVIKELDDKISVDFDE